MGALDFTQKSKEEHLKMKLSICLLVVLALLSTLLPEAESSPARGRARKRNQGRARSFRGARRMQQRRGRQDEADVDVPSDDMNAVDADYDDAEGSGGEELYNGCDWKTNIGGFLNFCKWRKWCADNQGITDFGPYGGVPTACPPEEEGADDPEAAADAAEVEVETPAEEARRRARARKSRARRGRKSGAGKKRTSRKGGRRAGKNRRNRSG